MGRSSSAGLGAAGAWSVQDPCVLWEGRSVLLLQGARQGMHAWLAPHYATAAGSFSASPGVNRRKAVLLLPCW